MTTCVINNCTDLITCLENATQGEPGSEFIELSAALFDAAGELATALLLESLTVTQLNAETALIQPGDPSGNPCVRIVGKAVLFPSGPTPTIEYSVEISADVIGTQNVRLLLDGTPLAPSEWTFAKNFAPFPDYYGYEDPGLEWLPSFYNDIVINQPHFRVSTAAQGAYPQGLSFEGVVDLTQGTLSSISSYFPGASQVSTRGPVVLRANTYPALNLTGNLPGYEINQLGQLKLNFGTKDAGPDPDKEPAASTLLLVGTTLIGNFPTIKLSAPVLQGNFVWDITGEVENKEQYSLAAGLQALVSYVNNHNLPLLSGLNTPGFFLDAVTVSITPSTSPVIHSIGFRVASVPTKTWTAPILGLGISGGMFVEWQVVSPFGETPRLVGMFGGTLILGSGSTAARFHLQVLLPNINSTTAPDVEIVGQLDPTSPIRVDALFKQFTGIDIELDLVIAEFLFEASTGSRTLQFQAQLAGTWPFPIPLVEFGDTLFFFRYTPNGITGSVSMAVAIASFEFLVSAEYSTGANWQFSGQLAPDSQNRTLQDFVDKVTDNQYPNLPANLGAITLQRFDVSFNTGTGAFSFDGALSWPFVYDDLPTVTLEAAISLNSPGPPAGEERQYSGFVSGKLSVNAFNVGVIYNFGVVGNTTITFVIQYNNIIFTCVYSRDPKTGDSIIRANLGGVSFGDIVEYLVNLVDPNLGFSLSPPWDILNQIKFDNLNLVVNLTRKTVGISYKLDQNLGIANIDTIALTYVNKAGKTTVQISITGRFVDQTFTDSDPLSWDLLNEPAPTPAGKGDQLLDLRYLGLGQNVGFRDARAFPDVQSVIKALEQDFVPTGSDDQNPLLLPILDTLKFTGNGHWLIGADFTVIGAVSISMVFNDPTLYGLRIALSGDKVGSFSGLDFQILYKKITDTIGVYHIELTLPEAFRQLQFGVVSVTIPTVVIDIYTNGNFRIDMGFPVGLDFSKSFCVQAGPFIGYGGFYFAVLNGATSERVPKITNGTFSPVIEAGLAVNVGLGRTFNKGILSAGVTVTMVAVVEGVFAWFNPNNTSVASAQYYLIQGTAAIVGKLYGKVDFGIIQANVNVTAQAQVTLTIEAYKAIQIGLSLAVSVSVSIKIAFIRISFSFKMTLDLSFTIGSNSTPPWQLETAQTQPLLLRQQAGMYSRRRLSGALLQHVLLVALNEDGTFDWTPRKVFPTIQTVELSLLPALTVALPGAVLATHLLRGDSTGEQPQYQIVMSLFAENSISTEARTAKEVRLLASSNSGATPFDLLVSGMFKWALSSYTRPPGVDDVPPPSQYVLASDLEAISDFLADQSNWQSVFTYDALAALMELNYVLQIRTPMGPSGSVHPSGLVNADDTAPEVSATVFPMIPDLTMGPEGLPPVEFWNYNCIDADYEAALAAYYRQLQVNASTTGPAENVSASNQPTTNFRVQDGPQGCPAGSESLSTFVFRDYFAMLTKGAVNAAIDLLKSYPYEPTGSTGASAPPESLQSIADQFNSIDVEYTARAGDTLGTIAGRHGVSLRQLKSTNPHLLAHRHDESLAAGTEVSINTGVTPESIVAANPEYPLQYKTEVPISLTITGAQHQVQAGPSGGTETLKSISAQYGLSGPTGPASLFTYQLPTGNNPNADNTSLLQPGAQIDIPAQTFTVASPIDATQELVSAFFFVRSIGPPQPDQTPWSSYQQFYEQWMLDNPGPTGATAWTIPIVKLQGENLFVSGTGQYVPQGAEGSALAPDTRALAAGYFAMSQLLPEPFTKSYENFKTFVSPTGPPSYDIAQFPYTVQPGDTVNGVAQLFGVSVDDLVTINAGATGMLQPLAVVALPTLEHPIQSGDTFSSVAANYDLTLDQLAESVRDNDGILTPYSPDAEPLTIPDLSGRITDQLIDDLARLGRFNDVSGMVTRFLLHGLRVPARGSESGQTFPPDTPLWGLYEMTGQQFPAPAGASGPEGFEIEFTKGATSNWVCLVPSPTGPPECEDSLTVYLTQEFFKNAPSTTLAPEVLAGPSALPLFRDTQRQYSISENIHWQATTSPTLPGPTGSIPPVAGQPSVWNFPQTLLRVAMEGPTGPTATPQYEMAVANPNDPSGESDRPVGIYCWASTIDVRIQRAPSASDGQFMPNTYLVLGADQAGRERLLSAWTYLQDISKQAQLNILYPPSATSNNTNGLASDVLDPVQTFVLKTNLTTVTQSNQSALLLATNAPPPSGEYYARLAAVTDFLRLVWEASVTGSGGFYLNYVNANGGAGLPETLFANGDTATITLLLISPLQAEAVPPDRGLYPFNNCAVVGDNIDPSSMQLYVKSTKLDLVRVATVPAGLAGFYLARKNPESGSTGPLSPDEQTRNLYNLAGYQIAENNYFTVSNQGLPVGPDDTPVAGVPGPTGSGVWWYQQVLPVYKFGKVNDTPSSAALPPVAENPYAGITGPTGTVGKLSEVAIDLAFNDVYGNETLTVGVTGGLTGPFGYIDELIGISSWPAAGADYTFVPGPANSVRLETRLSMQLDKYSPAEGYSFEQSNAAAIADAQRYAQIFYQVQQHDLGFDLHTNLGHTLIEPDALKANLTAFVSKAKVFADACASQPQQQYVTVANDQLAAIADAYSVTPGMLVSENQDMQVAQLFPGKIVQPFFAVAGPMNSLQQLVVGFSSTPYPPQCSGTAPTPDCSNNETGPALQPSELLTHNQTSALTPGIVLRTQPRVDVLPSDIPNTLVAAAAALQCVVYGVVRNPDATGDSDLTITIGLYIDNYTATGVVAPNLIIVIDGKEVDTGSDPTFESVEAAFSDLGLAQPDFVVKLQTVEGIFVPDANLTHADFIVPQPPPSQIGPAVPVFNITNLPASCGTIEFLANQNRVVENFFNAGSALYMSACCYQPESFDTFASLAAQFNNITFDQLAQFNSNTPLQADVSLAIPNLTYFSDPLSVYAPYSPRSSDSLTSMAGTFNSTTAAIAEINRYLPGIFADDATISGVEIDPLDSLQSVADALKLPFDQFINQIKDTTNLYRTQGTVLTPLPVIPGGEGVSPTPTQLAEQFNIQSGDTDVFGTSLLTTNRSLEGFLRPGAVIAGPAPAVPITVKDHDTVNTIINQFARVQGLQVTVAELAIANASAPGLFTVNQPFLLPPNITTTTSDVRPTIPPDGNKGEAAIVFPVSVSVDMTRPLGLVAPDFQDTAAVYENTTTFSPRGLAQGASSVNLTAFARDFESAFADDRLKCAVVQKDAMSSPQAAQLFAVNFGESGVRRFVVDEMVPQFYSMAPLSTKLLNGTLPIRKYISGCGLGPVEKKTFDAVDLDSWMGQFLSAVDLFLTANYSIPAFQLDDRGPTGSTSAGESQLLPAPAATGPVGMAGISLESGLPAVDADPSGCTGGTGAYGPYNYDEIVAAKYGIAQQLSAEVVPILDSIGPTAGYYSDVAQETLYQQMLVRLTDAYNVNAVVQYAVDLESPCVTPLDPQGVTGPLPPRVSGQIIPDLFAAPVDPGGDVLPPVPLQDLLAHFNVSLAFIAETIAGVQGLLQAGVTVTYNAQTYTIQQNDMLNLVADHLGVETDPSAPGYWESWTQFITGIAAQPILVAGWTLSVVQIKRTVYTGDTIETIAEFFGTDAATVGEANQSQIGIFAPVELKLNGYEPYAIQVNDTLLTMAPAIVPIGDNPPLTVGTLAQAASGIPSLLPVGEILYLTQVLPDITLSTSKVSLGRVDDKLKLAPPLSFLFSIKHPRQYRKLFLSLKYVINEMEFGIRNVPNTDGYQASSWLTFVLPIGSGEGADVGVKTEMSQVQIPIPLRAYPVPPTLSAQSSQASEATSPPVTPEDQIAQGKSWDYRIDFQSTNAAQDSNHVQVSFNSFAGPTGSNSLSLSPKRVQEVFGALAEFIDASASLTADLALLLRQPNQTAAIAVSVLDTFATNVARALGYTAPLELFGAQWPALTYLYKLQTTAANNELSELTLTYESGPSGATSPLWPDVFVRSLTAPTGGTGPDAGFLPLTRFGPTSGMTATFSYPPDFPADVPITQRFLFEERDVIQNQNASGGIYLTRNDNLIASGPLGAVSPTGSTGPQKPVDTSEAFLYQTPMVSFINPLTPILSDSTPIDVANLRGPSGPTQPPRTLPQHIENMLDAVLELGPDSPVQADSEISILCSYAFSVGGEGGIVATTPIRLVPAQLMTASTKTGFAHELSKSILSWPGWPGYGGPGELIFDLNVFTTAGGDTSDSSLKPILEFEILRVPVSQIVPA
ncbi:MAG TPA: LysM domain-containing protein [Pyrinomonadaceae bacterium]|nr:LysM domain-containing protein [Pyrinomonadaceae bacterium]